MSKTKIQSDIDAQAVRDTITATANLNFINSADVQIQEAIDLGIFWVSCVTTSDLDPKTIFDYYTNLGYTVSFPVNANVNPAGLFGENWLNFWMNGGILPIFTKKPYRFIISWKTPIVFQP